MKILITNTVVLNGGDAAILQSIMDVLRAEYGADTEFVVFDSQPEIARRYYPGTDFRKLLYYQAGWAPHLLRNVIRPGNLRRFKLAASLRQKGMVSAARQLLTDVELQDLKEYESADLIVSTGGTYLVENYDLAHRIFDFEIALKVGKPLVFYTQSLGPFAKKYHRRVLRGIFEKARLVLLRDALSLEHLVELGVKSEHLHVSADVVFALAGQADDVAAQKEGEGAGGLRVAVSVRDWAHFVGIKRDAGMANYLEAVAGAVTALVREKGAEVTFLSTCQGIPEYWTHDSVTAHKIVAMLPADVREKVEVDEGFHTPNALVGLLAGFDLVIATRMHMAILSLVAKTAVLPIAYEFKTTELFERIGTGAWTQDINTIGVDEFVGKTLGFLGDLEAIRAVQLEGAGAERERALAAGALVRAMVSGSGSGGR